MVVSHVPMAQATACSSGRLYFEHGCITLLTFTLASPAWRQLCYRVPKEFVTWSKKLLKYMEKRRGWSVSRKSYASARVAAPTDLMYACCLGLGLEKCFF